MTAEDWARLIEQLGTLPGGAAAARPDFFGSLVRDEAVPAATERDLESWPLKDGNRLCLRLDEADSRVCLCHLGPDGETAIGQTGRELLTAADQGGVSPLLLILLAIATGQIDDRKRLKQNAAGIDGAAKDLMLMTVCRLCG